MIVTRSQAVLLPWVPACAVCGTAVETVVFEWLQDETPGSGGKTRYLETGEVRVTVRCHGRAYARTGWPR